MMKKLFEMFNNDLGIDLGTANTLVHVAGEGIVLSEPSVVAIDANANRVLAVGAEAKRMLGRTPGNIIAIRPMRDGVIADFEIVEKMIRYFIIKVTRKKTLVKPRVVIGVPSGITEVERRAVQESCEQAGAREIHLIEEPLSAAIGSHMPINEPAGNMIVDIGGGTTEIAVISLGSMVIENSIRIGGDEFDDAIIQFLKRTRNLIIGERTAEDIKMNLANVWEGSSSEKYEIKGRDSTTGLPRVYEVSSLEVKEALEETMQQIVDEIKNTLDQTPAELAADIMDRGIVLSGGGSLIKGLTTLVSHETGVPVLLSQNPLTCVAEGTGIYLEELKDRRKKNYIKI